MARCFSREPIRRADVLGVGVSAVSIDVVLDGIKTWSGGVSITDVCMTAGIVSRKISEIRP